MNSSIKKYRLKIETAQWMIKRLGATTVTEIASHAQIFVAIAGPHAPVARTSTHETAPELVILNLQPGNSISLQRQDPTRAS